MTLGSKLCILKIPNLGEDISVHCGRGFTWDSSREWTHFIHSLHTKNQSQGKKTKQKNQWINRCI